MNEIHFDKLIPKPKTLSEEEKKNSAMVKMVDKINERQVIKYVDRQEKYEVNKKAAHSLLLGQCTKGLKSKLKARSDWDGMKNDSIKLIKAIKEITHQSV